MQAVINHFQYEDFKNAEYNERAEHDNARFLNLQPVNVDIKPIYQKPNLYLTCSLGSSSKI